MNVNNEIAASCRINRIVRLFNGFILGYVLTNKVLKKSLKCCYSFDCAKSNYITLRNINADAK